MQINVEVVDHKARISLNGRFDFNSHREFRHSYDSPLKTGAVSELEVDLGEVQYLDSSALGMLLMLKEKAQAADKSITLSNCRGTVKEVLDIANFGKLFNIR